MTRRALPLTVALALLVSGCNGFGGMGEAVRKHTYPPDFDYVSRDELRSTMWVLASQIKTLDTLLAQEQAEPGSHNASIQQSLEAIDSALVRIQVDTPASNHPLLEEHVPEVQARVARALRDSRRDPPSYFAASTLADSCFLCHARGRP